MTRAERLFALAVLCAALGGLTEWPLLIGLGIGLGVAAWMQAGPVEWL